MDLVAKKVPTVINWNFNNKNWKVRISPTANEKHQLYGWIDDHTMFVSQDIPGDLLPYFYIFLYHNYKSNLGKPNCTRLAMIEELNTVPATQLSQYMATRRQVLAAFLDRTHLYKSATADNQEIQDQIKLLDEIEK